MNDFRFTVGIDLNDFLYKIGGEAKINKKVKEHKEKKEKDKKRKI